IANSRADEAEAAAFQFLAHGVGLGGASQEVLERSPCVDDRVAAGELPDVGIEAAELLLYGEECLGILDRRADLLAVADDAGVGEQLAESALAIASDLLRIKLVERGAIILALLQHRVPAQTRLGRVEDQELEELAVVVQ